jgi:DNA polymerase III epsilon subunit-like protein
MQLAMILSTEEVIYGSYHAYIKSDGRTCHPGARGVHGISDEVVDQGVTSSDVWKVFESFWLHSDTFVCHNFGFDIEFIANLSYRGGPADQETEDSLREHPAYCTMRKTTDLLKIPFKSKAGYKFPKLEELYDFLFPGEEVQLEDVTTNCREET